MTKLFIDDVRECPEGWVAARTHEEVDAFCAEHGCPEEVSFDYDMGLFSLDGYEIAKRMLEGGMVPATAYVHSMNPTGAQRIMDLLSGHGVTVFRAEARK